jgi:hypothetical protein
MRQPPDVRSVKVPSAEELPARESSDAGLPEGGVRVTEMLGQKDDGSAG